MINVEIHSLPYKRHQDGIKFSGGKVIQNLFVVMRNS